MGGLHDAEVSRSRRVWVMNMIRKEFTVIRVFHGTLGDGDAYAGQLNRPA
jgi:hypothetical protein